MYNLLLPSSSRTHLVFGVEEDVDAAYPRVVERVERETTVDLGLPRRRALCVCVCVYALSLSVRIVFFSCFQGEG